MTDSDLPASAASTAGDRFSDPRQEQIHNQLLNLAGDSPAAFYRDACQIMALNPPLASTTHLVGHCLREIEGALLEVLVSVVADPKTTGPATSESSDCEKGETHKVKIERILQGLQVPADDPVRLEWKRLAGTAPKWAHRSSLAPPRPVDDEFREFWESTQNVLYEVLLRFEGKFAASLSPLDDLLAVRSPGRKQVTALLTEIPNTAATYGYFFDRIENPQWLRPLREKKLFERPPEPQTTEEGGVSLPLWPQGRLLARMADRAPDLVKEIILEDIPDTENPYVHENIADAACSMPANIAAEVWSRASEGLSSPYYLRLPQKLSDLVVHLAHGGKEEALELARELLKVEPETANPWRKYEGMVWPATIEPRARFEPPALYKQALKECIPVLVETTGERVVALLCEVLEDSVAIMMGADDDEYAYSDPLNVETPFIEESPQNFEGSPAHMLASATRDATGQLTAKDPELAPGLVAILEERDREVFDRLAFHLLRRAYEKDPGIVAEMIDERLLGKVKDLSDGLRVEYALLARERAADMDEATLDQILTRIGEGPPAEWLEERRSWLLEDEADVETALPRKVKRWKQRRFVLFGEALPEAWKARYDELDEELGLVEEPYPLDSPSRGFRASPPTKTADELRSMDVDDLAEFLRQWRADETLRSIRRLNLVNELAKAVASDAGRIAANARKFEGLHLAFVRSILWGFHDALAEKDAQKRESALNGFEWEPVLRLCGWTLEQQHLGVENASAEQEREAEVEEVELGLIGRTVAQLLETGLALSVEAGGIPFVLQEDVWNLLEPLTEDPDPMPVRDRQIAGSSARGGTTPHGLSINSARGYAMHAVMRYALAVQHHLAGSPDGEQASLPDLSQMPEVQRVLERRLDAETEPSRAVRSVYGYWLPELIDLDREWFENRKDRILPADGDLGHLYDAAWQTYVARREPSNESFEALRDHYARAIEKVGGEASEPRQRLDPNFSMAYHLMVLVWKGTLLTDEPDSLATRFFEKADDELRGHALSVLGKSMLGWDGEVPDETLERLKSLWKLRLKEAEATSAAGTSASAHELGAFGWWFVSAKFEDGWAAEQLARALEGGGNLQNEFVMVRRLATVAPEFPHPATRCLEKIVEKSSRGILGLEDEAKQILSAGVHSGEPAAEEQAHSLVSRLVARGYANLLGDLRP